MPIALVRLLPVAPFTVVNFVAGAAGLDFPRFMIGSLLGLLPGIAFLTVLADTFLGNLKAPNALSVLLVLALGGLIVAIKRFSRHYPSRLPS